MMYLEKLPVLTNENMWLLLLEVRTPADTLVGPGLGAERKKGEKRSMIYILPEQC